MDKDQIDENNRRPLAVRDVAITRKVAIWLSKKDVTPNQISLMSIGFAVVGYSVMLTYYFLSDSYLLLLAAVAIQMRLLCNLFDGMVAIEGGKKTPAGELYNDVPDRIADPLFIVAAGFATESVFGMPLAWTSAIVAVLTAYVRVLGVSMGTPADFQGPMAKQHRMALITVTYLFLFLQHIFSWLPNIFIYSMDAALLIMLLGSVYTTWRRLAFISEYKTQNAIEEEQPKEREPQC
ncbi:CDP-alcohol phosphatidyltransferase family protein [Vibrio tubiashii]|uniref:CDP-alcohol phosphatidyltransferase family protein n=1 Tax=Vibrio tubiashii TaxID=29498 RepID=UPI001EFC745C|nr:CDP-alcohol phosphatidyltransferase family protein [Vibrio tubiashii]MCG9582388.1 CDP-alcohol phosphatidyltransferase family protein [Vibrio tubiashii]MCG9615979.1 CDP-alcohol phosphatidyltransferase family protein [Vibrio tubiashii]MCG9689788.1 CDP-alcohol phosphatidyltransferase family protein [Vibrio tubiashii]